MEDKLLLGKFHSLFGFLGSNIMFGIRAVDARSELGGRQLCRDVIILTAKTPGSLVFFHHIHIEHTLTSYRRELENINLIFPKQIE